MMVGYTAFQKFVSAILALLLILICGGGFRFDLPTVLIASFSGLTLFMSGFCSVYAMKGGTVSLSSMFSTAGMIVPVIAGAVLFDKPVGIMQVFGLGMFFVAAWLLIGSSKEIYTGFSGRTMLLLLGSLVANGGTMLAQQMFTAFVPDGDVSVFSFLSFGIISLLSAIVYRSGAWTSEEQKEPAGLPKTLVICGVALATAVFVINQLATLSTKLISPIILFTFINGGATIISTVVAAIMYKERISKKSALGIMLGIVSLVVIKMFEVN